MSGTKDFGQSDDRRENNTEAFQNTFLVGNEAIDAAIAQYYAEPNDEHFTEVLQTIRYRMHRDGHFLFPVFVEKEDETRFAFRSITTKDGKTWNAAFTSQKEYEKGAPSQVMSYFIDSAMKFCLSSEAAGMIVNPWGQQPFFFSKEMMEMIIKADGDVEYAVPDTPITAELLADGTFLKKAVEICSRNVTQLNLMKLARILRDSCQILSVAHGNVQR